jgi:Mg-chelatase subunit ChlD
MSTSTTTDILICPITQQIMTDPVTDRDGNTYDRSAIMQWLATNSTSPITRRSMTAAELVPNRIVRDLLDAAAGRGQVTQSAPSSGAAGPPVIQRTAENITAVIVLDASGSMSTSCDLPGEATGMTRIDLTKYSARVIIESLRPGDRLGLIAFSDSAFELAPIRQINSDYDKQILTRALDRYSASGSTNIYDAMIKAITTLSRSIQPGEPASVFLLTDGEPTINPPDLRNQGVTRSTLDTVMRSIGQNPSTMSALPNITINTFGYGYSLMGDLMTGLTQLGDSKPGIFGFIPDATMLGTVLINAMSRTRYSEPAQLNPDDITVCNQVGNMIHRLAQSTDTPNNIELFRFITQLENQDNRTALMDALLLDLMPNTDPNLGQVNKAVQPEHYRKWGRYYLMALATGFQTRTCLNFKDNALQCFKTPSVEQEQTRLSDIFLTATPPTPTGSVYNRYGRTTYSSATGPVNMSTYLNAAGGCFGPDSLITSATGAPIRISELKAGHLVRTPDGDTTVTCVIEQPYSGDLYKVHNGLWLTPWHPFVRSQEPARFPAEDTTLTKIPYNGIVYNLVLANRKLVGTSRITLADANDNTWAQTNTSTWAATLGHSGYSTDTVLAHPYYGSEAVIDDLKATGQFERGHVIVQGCEVHRDPDTNLVSAITYHVV